MTSEIEMLKWHNEELKDAIQEYKTVIEMYRSINKDLVQRLEWYQGRYPQTPITWPPYTITYTNNSGADC